MNCFSVFNSLEDAQAFCEKPAQATSRALNILKFVAEWPQDLKNNELG